MIKDTGFFSKKTGRLSKGCRQCVRGRKLVMFVTGLCHRKCWYCPLSEKRMQKDVIFANEWQIDPSDKDLKDIITEARLTEAEGAGITGGEPTIRLERTCRIIRLLKKEFGKDFHIHIYTSPDIINKEKLDALYDSGVDEIRFHPDIDKPECEAIRIAAGYSWDVGIEIPAIPGYEKKTIEMIKDNIRYISFINLNELEITSSNSTIFRKKKLHTSDDVTQAIAGSWDSAKKIMERFPDANIHFCTARLKDSVQLKNRILIRAKNIATEFDDITDDGTLVRPVIYGDIRILKQILHGIPHIIDKDRAIVDPIFLKDNLETIKKAGLKPAVVEEYPTHDATIMQLDYL